ncbi:MAG: hypothetical protein LBM77_06810 [Spirochaetaceae bacterium]|jgi:hypothetical protein|nr:hypothetical protein [Spirochaetaceae bacterium]
MSDSFDNNDSGIETAESNAAENTAKPAGNPVKGILNTLKSALGGVYGTVAPKIQAAGKGITIGILVIVLLIILVILGINLGTRGAALLADRRATQAEQKSAATLGIVAPEEIYLPVEPDSAPDLIYSREQREKWTADEVREYWERPMDDRSGEPADLYEDEISATVDSMMEKIP